MKKLLLTSFALFGLMTSSSFAYTDCTSGCTYDKCGLSQDKWNECFKNCWRYHPDRIPNCIAGAKQESKITKEQEFIMGYFSGGERDISKFVQNHK